MLHAPEYGALPSTASTARSLTVCFRFPMLRYYGYRLFALLRRCARLLPSSSNGMVHYELNGGIWSSSWHSMVVWGLFTRSLRLGPLMGDALRCAVAVVCAGVRCNHVHTLTHVSL